MTDLTHVPDFTRAELAHGLRAAGYGPIEAQEVATETADALDFARDSLADAFGGGA